MGITRWTLGPWDGSGPTVLEEAGIPTFLHIRDLSTSLFLFGRGSAVGRLQARVLPFGYVWRRGLGCYISYLLPPSCQYSGKSAHKIT